MLPRGIEIMEGDGAHWRRVAVRNLLGSPSIVLCAERESDGERLAARVVDAPAQGPSVLVRLTDGHEFRCGASTRVLLAGFGSAPAADLLPGAELYPLGKWARGFAPPAAKVVAEVVAQVADDLCAVIVSDVDRFYALAAGVFLAADPGVQSPTEGAAA